MHLRHEEWGSNEVDDFLANDASKIISNSSTTFLLVHKEILYLYKQIISWGNSWKVMEHLTHLLQFK